MGQKANPIGMRIGIIRTWDSKWYAINRDVPKYVKEDFEIRKYLTKLYKEKKAGFSHAEIERKNTSDGRKVVVSVFVGKPGVAIGGRKDDAPAKTTKELTIKALNKIVDANSKFGEISFRIVEVRRPERCAAIAAQNIADELEKRASFRKAQKNTISRALKAGAKGAKTLVSGRLGGAEIARGEGYSEGRVPLHTLRADIDYATCEADTTYGKLGIKVWIYNGEVTPGKTRESLRESIDGPAPERRKPPRDNNSFRPRPKKEEKSEGGN
ncbi:MAG: 30S ribosomal protein S3 [Acholeplasmatales bacterium]|jgi:small subunit ribosomal protein S3|nr:30S ribosomal protein S3 [Acholeplasmatales bacterium]